MTIFCHLTKPTASTARAGSRNYGFFACGTSPERTSNTARPCRAFGLSCNVYAYLLACMLLWCAADTGKCLAAKAETKANKRYELTGGISWYGTTAHGLITANGEVYNRYALTAAHKKLPLGTVVRVTNNKNGKHVLVRVNDRGPYIKGRVLDVSFRAAQTLKMTKSGVVPGQVRIVSDKQGRPLNKKLAFFVHATNEKSALQAKTRAMYLKKRYGAATRVVQKKADSGQVFAVYVGPFATFSEAQHTFLRIENNVMSTKKRKEALPALGDVKTPTLGIVEAPIASDEK